MIVALKGSIHRLSPLEVELDVRDVTYLVNITLLTSMALKESIESKKESVVRLEILQIIKEDSNSLYGFLSKDERAQFINLLKVQGVGAKMALNIMSTYSSTNLAKILSTNDLNALKAIKGIGLKVANKILLELSGEVKVSGSNEINLAREALLSLGFKESQVSPALSGIDETLNSSEMVKVALKKLS
ncbi:Holliday junction branch migration protein RuvA [Helicobacter sp. 11S02629-2]|uniref:Holliday junction branch migration protein RuvA n=1 Tax=Helicobacter sp. 11S02629-2 TaxID=1476195 RepID=UPI000BA725D8|nr:Holliday junction branch migration protein RuvA [Helicobacter sp. 11S02629-2]PAF44960.1 Holliday junction DNA helicase RuvA [Helicobacter sp. 11S02629-2]